METKPEINNLIVDTSKVKKQEKKSKLIIEDDYIIKTKIFELIIPIPDCFVSPNLKLSKGKDGHGERRLYTGDNNNNNEYICKKPWFINYPSNYKNEIEELLNDDENFSKPCNDRKCVVYNAIDSCNKILIDIYLI